MSMTLQKIREQIDATDEQICELIRQRFEYVKEVAGIKKEQNTPILNSGREREIIDRITAGMDDSMAGYLKILYTTMFDLSRTEQGKILNGESKVAVSIKTALANTDPVFPKSAVVACQGNEGSYSMSAAEKMINRPSILYFDNFEGVFSAVEKGLCRYGVLPIENSLRGSVKGVYDLMNQHHFYIVKAGRLKINHCLLAKEGTNLKDIHKVYSHEQALGQCSEFLKSLNAEVISCENTAAAAKMVAESKEVGVAAISSEICAELYGLVKLGEGIQNNENNYTRFICISKQLEIYPGAKKISLQMTLLHKPGALYGLMARFAALGINLTKLESRPLPETDFEFLFYFDLDISVYDEAVMNLFAELEACSNRFLFMGCYSED